jgi:hypothetical protein
VDILSFSICANNIKYFGVFLNVNIDIEPIGKIAGLHYLFNLLIGGKC